jgi:5-methylcytosine-specific restriction endonuclease McrA
MPTKTKATSNRNRGRAGFPKPPNILQQLTKIQNGLCYLCGSEWYPGHALLWPTLDHVVPHSKGGRRSGNLLVAHACCNVAKGNRSPKPCEMIYLAAANAMRVAA